MSASLDSFLLFAVAASGTPGPNNVMVMGSAATRGLRTTVPMVLGVVLGFGIMVVVGLRLAWPLAIRRRRACCAGSAHAGCW